jgi:hypothetical protein
MNMLTCIIMWLSFLIFVVNQKLGSTIRIRLCALDTTSDYGAVLALQSPTSQARQYLSPQVL